MKRITLLFVLCYFSITMVNAQTTAIPDANFEQALIDLGIDTNGLNGNILNTDAASQTGVLVVSNKNISDLTGIGAFVNISGLYCDNNQLTNLDLSQNSSLQALFCSNNLLTSLDLSQNTALTYLICDGNQITNLDLSQNIVLEFLYCYDNLLMNLTLNQNTLLTDLRCYTNQINTLDLSQNSLLTHIGCANNQLTSLNLKNGNNTNITFLDTVLNPNLSCITVDDVAYSVINWTNSVFNSIYIDSQSYFTTACNTNTIAIPDANFEQALINLGIDSNGLNGNILEYEAQNVTSLNIANKGISDLTGIESFTSLQNLTCSDNSLTSLNVTQNIYLQSLTFRNNQIANIDLSQNTALKNLYCTGNQITNIDLSQNIVLETLYCYDNLLMNLTLNQNTLLTDLRCYNNQINTFDLSQNTALKYLHCYSNQISNLDVSQNTELITLRCNNNQLEALDLSQNINLTQLICNDNQLVSLDLSQNIAFRDLDCSNNQLIILDVKNGNNSNMPTVHFRTTNNTGLTCINVDDVAYSTSNWIYIDPSTSFSTNCGPPQTYVPDDNFEQALIDLGYDSGPLDDYISTSTVINITSLDVSNKNITDLTGIENFTSLLFLDCYVNQLASLDVSNITSLIQLKCGTNQLTSLDLSNNPNLSIFNCFDNQLTSLNVKNGNNYNVSFFKADNNPNLNCVTVDDATWSTANWTYTNLISKHVVKVI